MMKEGKKNNRYFGFDDVLENFYKVKPKTVSKTNEEFKKKFEKRHSCKSCGNPLTYVGGNVMVCKNSECSGSYFELLDEHGKEIAQSLYGG